MAAVLSGKSSPFGPRLTTSVIEPLNRVPRNVSTDEPVSPTRRRMQGYPKTIGEAVYPMSCSASLAPSHLTVAAESVLTNAFVPGQGVQIQRYQTYVGEYLKGANDRHFIKKLSEVAWAERRRATGSWVRSLMQRGSLTIVPSGPVPEARLLTSPNIIICALEKNFTHEIALEINGQPARDTAFPIRDTQIEGLVDLMIRDFETSSPCTLYSETLAHALAMQFLAFGSSSKDMLNSSVEPLPPRILSRIRDRIEAGLDSKLSLASLAKESGYSRAHFLRMFRTATGLTPHQYVLERRLSAAQQLLRQSRMLLADIALRCGFSSQTHMNDVFRKRLGLTPREYRRNT
jgi:AraC family transcriptional regulator